MLINKNFKLIKEFNPQKTNIPIVNKTIKLINNSKKEGSKKSLLYFLNKNQFGIFLITRYILEFFYPFWNRQAVIFLTNFVNP